MSTISQLSIKSRQGSGLVSLDLTQSQTKTDQVRVKPRTFGKPTPKPELLVWFESKFRFNENLCKTLEKLKF